MSDKTIAEKLFIKPGFKVAILNSPNDFASKMNFPDGVQTMDYIDINIDVIHGFVNNKTELDDLLDRIKAHDTKYVTIWIAYPKNIGKEMNRDVVLHMAADRGFRADQEVIFDDVWTSLRFKLESYI